MKRETRMLCANFMLLIATDMRISRKKDHSQEKRTHDESLSKNPEFVLFADLGIARYRFCPNGNRRKQG
ncbi:MAG: hypothetical protein KDH98_09740 [Calditrichaeota bacterium]|nr:hypothetical protein [Calditrichota bacterium]